MKRAPIAVYLDYDGYVAVWSWRRKHDRRVEATGFDTEDAACEWLQKQGELYRPATSPAIEAKTKPQEQGKHTPGPWKIVAADDGLGRYPDGSRRDRTVYFIGARPADADRVNYAPEIRDVAEQIAHVGENEANARLIAAAPDTYGVCDLIMLTEAYNAANRDYPTVEQWNEIVKAARAAIARAEQEGK